MASNASPGAIPAASAVLNSQPSDPAKFPAASGKSLPQSGNGTSPAAIPASNISASAPQSSNSAPPASNPAGSSPGAASASSKASVSASTPAQGLAEQLNKVLNNSGRADQFRVDPASQKYIQQVNPASGAVIAEYSIEEFPALARSIGASGLLLDETA